MGMTGKRVFSSMADLVGFLFNCLFAAYRVMSKTMVDLTGIFPYCAIHLLYTIYPPCR